MVPAKIGYLSSIKCVQPELFRVTRRAAQFASPSPTILESMGSRGQHHSRLGAIRGCTWHPFSVSSAFIAGCALEASAKFLRSFYAHVVSEHLAVRVFARHPAIVAPHQAYTLAKPQQSLTTSKRGAALVVANTSSASVYRFGRVTCGSVGSGQSVQPDVMNNV